MREYSFTLKAFLLALVIFPAKNPRAAKSANEMGQVATLLSAGAGIYSVYRTVQHAGKCPTPSPSDCLKAGIFGAAAVASFYVMTQNDDVADATVDETGSTYTGTTSGSTGGSSGGTTGGDNTGTTDWCSADSPLANTGFCKDGSPNKDIKNPTDVCKGPNAAELFACNPDAQEKWAEDFAVIKDATEKGLIDTQGLSTDEFLGNIDSGMKNLISKLNPSAGGKENSGQGIGSTSVAGSGESGGDGGGAGNASDASGRKGGGIFGFGKSSKKNGLSLLDADSGKEFGIFQRATRLYQGTKEGAVTGTRALSLAKIEKIRSESLKRLALNAQANKDNNKVVSLSGLESNKPAAKSAAPIKNVNLPQH